MSAILQASQIVCVDNANKSLYAEVIQIVSERQFCWARPIALVDGDISLRLDTVVFDPVESLDKTATSAFDQVLYDLREGADLLLPMRLFRIALDTEVIPLLTHLETSKTKPEGDRTCHQVLQDFVQQLCKTYPDAFQS
jgi:hypothetical protein